METDRSTVGDPDRGSSSGAGGSPARPEDDSAGSPTDDSAGSPTKDPTAARAVLRPVPDGFPTPPPRPALPNRRPAVQLQGEPAPDPDPQARRLVVVSLVVVAVLVLVVAIGGSILAYRALSPEPGPDAGPVTTAEPDPDAGDEADGDATAEGTTGGDASSTEIGEVAVHEVSTQLGVRSLGDGAGPSLSPDGEFVIVTLEIDNGSSEGVIIDGDEILETVGGTMHEPLADAAAQYAATESDPYGVVPAGTSGTFHLVYDVPVGSELTGVHLDFSDNASGGEGMLPVTG